MVQQKAGQARAVAAGALRRPAAAAQRPLGDEAQQRLIAGLAAGGLDLGDEPAGGFQDRGGVAVAVGVDPDDVVDSALKHRHGGCPPLRSGDRGATLAKAPRGRTVTSHDPKVGQASDQASDVVARPVPAA